ncbi:MAG: LPS assembly lipoprotein LptE [Flavobacteriaceae bacterium]|nr:LPS assembly lipoprotein LptE [Flavobacteriaceae bacterium]
MIFKKIFYYLVVVFCVLLCIQCNVTYNFTGGDVGDAKTFQVRFIQNRASESPGSIIQPQLDRDFTRALENLITNQSPLNLVSENGDLLYEGEIVEYRIAPMTATADQKAEQNRLTMAVNIRFFNNKKENVDFEKRFSFIYDFPGTAQLNSVKTEAHEALFERILQDIFNESLANW